MAKTMKFDYPYIEDFGGSTKHVIKHVIPEQKQWTALNPSIGYCSEQGYAVTIRSSNYIINPKNGSLDITIGNKVRNYLWFAELNDDLELQNLRQISFKDFGGPETYRGIEDARLFSRDGQWYFTGVMLEPHTPRSRLALYRLDAKENKAHFIKKYEGWDVDRPEKNWMAPALEDNPNFDYIYTGNGVVKGSRFILDATTDQEISNMRGGSSLWPLGDGSYLAVTHCVYVKPIEYYDSKTFGMMRSAIRNYTHQLVRISSTGKVLEMSEEFLFEHPGVEFAAGLVEKDGQFIISYGYEDYMSCFARIPREKALAMLNPVEEDFYV